MPPGSPLQTGEHPCRHQCDSVVAYPSATGDIELHDHSGERRQYPKWRRPWRGDAPSTVGNRWNNVCRPDTRRRGIAISQLEVSLDVCCPQHTQRGNTSAVTSRRLIVTSYNLAIIRFWYPATNNRDSVFTGSKHHVFMKIPVLETPSFLHLPLLSCLFVCLCANRGCSSYFDAFVPVFGDIQQFATQQLIGLVCVVSLAIPLCHWSRLFVTVLKLHHDYSVSIFPTRDSTR